MCMGAQGDGDVCLQAESELCGVQAVLKAASPIYMGSGSCRGKVLCSMSLRVDGLQNAC